MMVPLLLVLLSTCAVANLSVVWSYNKPQTSCVQDSCKLFTVNKMNKTNDQVTQQQQQENDVMNMLYEDFLDESRAAEDLENELDEMFTDYLLDLELKNNYDTDFEAVDLHEYGFEPIRLRYYMYGDMDSRRSFSHTRRVHHRYGWNRIGSPISPIGNRRIRRGGRRRRILLL